MALLALVAAGCDSLGIEGGASALQAHFSGIQTVQVLSPTSVQVNWTQESGYTGYNVYISTQDAPIASNIVFGTYKVTGLNPNTSYSFSVSGVKSDGSQDGISHQVTVQTWAPFVGPTSASAQDANDVNLNWSYENGPTYEIFYKEVPAGQTPATFTSTDLQGTPNTTSQSATGGIVGGLLPNSIYTFAIVAKYLDGTTSLSSSTTNQVVSETAIVTSQGQLLTVPTITTAQQISATSHAAFTVSGGAATYVSTVFQGTLSNPQNCPSIPAGQVLTTITANNTGTAASLLTAGTYSFTIQVKDTATSYCAYESIGPITVTSSSSSGSSIVTVNATTPSGISPLPVVTVNPVQLGQLPTFTVSGAMSGYTTQITYNGSVIATRLGNGSMTTLSTNPLPLGQVQVTPIVSYGGETATLSPITIAIKGIDPTKPIIGASTFNGGSASTPALGTQMVVGDFNCDGYPDLAVSAPLGAFGAPSGAPYFNAPVQGGVVVYYGTSSGLDFSTTPSTSPSGTHPLLISSPARYSTFGNYFGMNLAAGNLNGQFISGKPCSSLVVTASEYTYYSAGPSFYVYYGSQTGLQVTPTVISNNVACSGSGSCSTANFTLGGDAQAIAYQHDIQVAVGDFNGDGYDDVAFAAPMHTDPSTGQALTGEVFLFFGSSYGVSPNYKKFFPPTNMNASGTTHFGSGLAFGNTQSHASDSGCTAHGCKDLIVGIWGTATANGGVIDITGNSAALINVDATNHLSGGYGTILPGECTAGTWCGIDVTTADLNEDGYDDIIFSAPNITPPSPYNKGYAGEFFVYYGDSPLITGAGTTTATNTPIVNAASAPCSVARNGTSCSSGEVFYRTTDSIYGLFLGRTVKSIGDTNNDGYPEVAIGAVGYGGSINGAAYVYYGGPYGISSTTSTLANLNSPASAGFGMGLAGAQFSSPTFSTQFVSSSGALSPQHHDLVVGAPGETLTGQGNPGQGVVHFFANSGSGLGSSLTADTSKAPGVSSLALTIDLRSDVGAFVGDINGDGYGDVAMSIQYNGPPTMISGANRIDASPRHGFLVYYGSSQGLITTPEPQYAPVNPTDPLLVTDIEWGLNDPNLGFSVMGGDFNGDGFADVVASYTSTYLFYGSSTGLLTQIKPLASPISILDPKVIANFGDNSNGWYNVAVQLMTTGDFNGDGYSDLVIGSYLFTGGGRWIYVIYGSQSGIVSGGAIVSPNVTTTNPMNQSVWSNQGNQQVLSGSWPSAQMAPLGMFTCTPSIAAAAGTSCSITPTISIPFAASTTTSYFGSSHTGWTFFGPQRLLAVGDIDHDGTDDLVMTDENESNYAGSVYIFYGNQNNGIQPDQYARLRIQPLWGTYNTGTNPPTYTPDPGGYNRALGHACWGAPVPCGALSKAYDINGDGVGDFVVGAMEESSGTTSAFHQGGNGYVIYGINGGWKALGTSVCVPDPNNTSGSGYPCTVTITNWASAADNYNPARVITNSNTSCNPSTNQCNVLRFFPTGYNTSGNYFGEGILGLKDITGDGLGDVAVTQIANPNRLFIFSGAITGLNVTAKATNNPDCTSTGGSCAPYMITLPNDPTAQSLGINMSYEVNGWQGSGDVDHDGYQDFAVSSMYISDPTGKGYWNGGFYLFH